jgi:hypothetical protein
LNLIFNAQFVNPQDTSSQIQAAMKNLATNSVFYFVIPVEFESLFASGSALDVNSFASSWKSLDESAETSVVLKGIYYVTLFLD